MVTLRYPNAAVEKTLQRMVFDDPSLTTFLDQEHSLDEDRRISIGFSNKGRLLLVVHTENQDNDDRLTIRIISARKADRSDGVIYGGDK